MRVDVSEIKTFKTCRRQWSLSSRNKAHMRPISTPGRFRLGVLFHEALAQLYLGNSPEKVLAFVRTEMDPTSDVALLAMVPGYARNVLPDDMDRYKLLDIEHHFEFVPTTRDGEVINDDLTVAGSIDRIMLDVAENTIYGFEDKTCKDFRDDTYLWMDEQPRVYVHALMYYVKQYNARLRKEWESAGCPADMEPVPAKLGGIYMNEVKKLLRDFKYKRTLCSYSEDDLGRFMEHFFGTCQSCYNLVKSGEVPTPNPGFFTCSMCDFKPICATYMYDIPSQASVIEEFKDEFQVRTEDHLTEKTERSAT